VAFRFVAANGGRNECSPAVARRLQINFRFSRAPENGRWPSEAHFKGVRAMNLSDLCGLFNCVRAGDPQAASIAAKRTLFEGAGDPRNRIFDTNQQPRTRKYSHSCAFPLRVPVRREEERQRERGTESNIGKGRGGTARDKPQI